MSLNEDKIYEKLLEHDARFSAHDQKFADHDKQFDAVFQKLLDHDDKFEEMLKKMDENQKALIVTLSLLPLKSKSWMKSGLPLSNGSVGSKQRWMLNRLYNLGIHLDFLELMC